MLSVAGDWIGDDEGVVESAILGDVTPGWSCSCSSGVAVGTGWKDWSSSEHNTNIPLYSREKNILKIGDSE